jgi:hypothetical protein
MVHVSLDTPYMTLLKDFLAKKHRMAVDAWGADDTAVRAVYAPLIAHIEQEVAPKHRDLYPFPVWKLADRVNKVSLLRSFSLTDVGLMGRADDARAAPGRAAREGVGGTLPREERGGTRCARAQLRV